MIALLNYTATLNKTIAFYQKTSAILVVLGSNIHSDMYISRALDFLHNSDFFDIIQPICTHISPDYTRKSQTLYHNQGIYITLKQATNFYEILIHLKEIELACGKYNHFKPWVAIDIDILALYAHNSWYCIQERLPFKPHEIICLKNKHTL